MAEKPLPRCRFGCQREPAVVLVAVPEGCFCFPHDRKQWLCWYHYWKLTDAEHEFSVITDVISLGWAS